MRISVDAMFSIKVRNPIDPSPPKGPWLETRRQGPTLRNLAMPKVAENTDKKKVVQKRIRSLVLSPKTSSLFESFNVCMSITSRICNCGIDSKNGSETVVISNIT